LTAGKRLRFFYVMKNQNINAGDLVSWAGECYKVRDTNFSSFELSALWRTGIVVEINSKFIIVVDGSKNQFKIPLKNDAVIVKTLSKIEKE